ncbi:hypothetical protein O181_007285 [Austropuccinia psidii MF-1]|uniref:Uncharacterized protein n=1 Tax=Austropuccinia psidii MF-1 TaxID=1389203 RepID=A0A9Q3BM34_9BASI|nr:hypothetical protein [Austropuccinia psidii MF-1]
MSPNIPLTTPIASSWNVSGLKIDMGNPMAPTASTWAIPNILITPIPPNPTNTQIMCLSGQEAHLKSHQRLIPNQYFHMTSSLILVRIQLYPMNPLGKINSQPSIFHQDLRFMWAMKPRFMGGNKKDHWKILPRVVCQGEIWD